MSRKNAAGAEQKAFSAHVDLDAGVVDTLVVRLLLPYRDVDDQRMRSKRRRRRTDHVGGRGFGYQACVGQLLRLPGVWQQERGGVVSAAELIEQGLLAGL